MEIDGTTVGVIVVNVVGFTSLLVNQIFQSSAASRDRRWNREDDERKAAIAASALKEDLRVANAISQADAARLALALAEATRKIDEDRAVAEKSRQVIAELLAENTRITQDGANKASAAYDIANNVNEKIEKVAKSALQANENVAAALGGRRSHTRTPNPDAVPHAPNETITVEAPAIVVAPGSMDEPPAK